MTVYSSLYAMCPERMASPIDDRMHDLCHDSFEYRSIVYDKITGSMVTVWPIAILLMEELRDDQ